MPSYLVETYLARSRARHATDAARRARTVALELTREGTAVTYIRTTFLPDDETCFHLFAAGSVDVIEEVCRRARLERARVVPAIESCPPSRQPPQ
jgi:hypothetical protein